MSTWLEQTAPEAVAVFGLLIAAWLSSDCLGGLVSATSGLRCECPRIPLVSFFFWEVASKTNSHKNKRALPSPLPLEI